MFPRIIQELEDLAQLTQVQIADLVDGSVYNIRAIKKRGTIPNWVLGEKLKKLHAERCPDSDLLETKGRSNADI